MSIQAWLVILDAAILAVLGAGGWYFHNFLKERLARELSIKDATIQSLSTEVGRLKGMVSPVITAEHKFIREYAEEVTRNKQELLQRLKELEGARVEPRNMEIITKDAYLQGRAEGLIDYSEAIATLMDEAMSVMDSVAGSWTAADFELIKKPVRRQKEMFEIAVNKFKRLVELRKLDEK
jgi:hypothetical protein